MKPTPQNEPLPSSTPEYTMNMDSTPRRRDRIRHNTAPEINARIDEETADSIRLYHHADSVLIARRLNRLDREWDVDRRLETIAPIVVIVGVLLGAFVNPWWLLLPLLPAVFLLLRTTLGWFPPMPILRRFGVRSRKEIERERYALKLLRGDFDAFHSREAIDPNAVMWMLDL